MPPLKVGRACVGEQKFTLIQTVIHHGYEHERKLGPIFNSWNLNHRSDAQF